MPNPRAPGRDSLDDLILKRESWVLHRHRFEDDAVAESLELGEGPLTLTIGVAPDEVVAPRSW
jgi:hypothetical protein